jgi:ribose 5-phosphate isomerase B
MAGLTVALGADHGGFALKQSLVSLLQGEDCEVHDLGTHDVCSTDYPDHAQIVCRAVAEGRVEFGILCCGTGIGMSIAGNKVKGIRAAKCNNEFEAEMARRHNNANVLALGGRVITPEMAARIAQVFLRTGVDGGRHERRVQKIGQLEDGFQ